MHTADPNRTAIVVDGRVGCHAFPIVVITSNGEREFPPAFLRRCLQLHIQEPNIEQVAAMVANHLLDPQGELANDSSASSPNAANRKAAS